MVDFVHFPTELLLKSNKAQFVLLCGSQQRQMVYNAVIADGRYLGTYDSKPRCFNMYRWGHAQMCLTTDGDCAVRGELYKLSAKQFERLVKFEWGTKFIQIKLKGFKKKVLVSVKSDVVPLHQRILVDKPADMVYNWKKQAPVECWKTPPLPTKLPTDKVIQFKPKEEKETPVMSIPTEYNPNVKNAKGEIVNKDSIAYKILESLEDFEADVFDSTMDSAKRGASARRFFREMREHATSLSDVA